MKSRFQAALERRIQEELIKNAMSLISIPVKDYAEYRRWTGYAAAMNDVLSFCADIEKEMGE